MSLEALIMVGLLICVSYYRIRKICRKERLRELRHKNRMARLSRNNRPNP